MKKGSPNHHPRFERRDILKTLVAVPSAALISGASTAAVAAERLAETSASRKSQDPYQPKVLNPREWRTVAALCELIVPADSRSMSAREAGVPEFIDGWLDFKRGNLLAEIRGGLTWLDMECQRSFALAFADCSRTQQEHILDRIAYPEKADPEDAAAVSFFNRFRDLVISGFYTSAAGIRDLPYIGNEPQSEWNGCPAAVLAKLGLSRG